MNLFEATTCVALLVQVYYVVCVGSVQGCADGENVAFNKPAYMSTTFMPWNGQIASADRAVDGNFNTMFYGCNSCIHTHNDDKQPWWMVDLLQEYNIHSVEITNRLENGHLFREVDIETARELYNASGALVQPNLCFHVNTQADGSTVVYNCSQIVLARYVKIRATYRLHICEVRVFTNDLNSTSKTSKNICQKQYSVLKHNLIPPTAPMQTVRVESRTECAERCISTGGCLAFSLTGFSTDWECKLFHCNNADYITAENTTFFIQNLREL